MENVRIIENRDRDYPQNLLTINDYPKKLYIMGNYKLLNNVCIAIVGSRDSTPYGEKYAFKFAKELSKQGITIVSGMAIGIDTAAHFGAMQEKGKTIAVLGAGFNHIYPEENYSLFNRIVQDGGCVITEYKPDTEAVLSRFPKRNRIISGLSEGVLVVEAKQKSGSLITARYAKEQGKKIFSVPSNIDLKTGGGTNSLIKNGAKLVTCVEDILEELNIKEDIIPKDIEIEEDFKIIYSVINNSPININIIAKKSNLTIKEVTQKLLMMEIKGYIKSLPGNEYVRL